MTPGWPMCIKNPCTILPFLCPLTLRISCGGTRPLRGPYSHTPPAVGCMRRFGGDYCRIESRSFNV